MKYSITLHATGLWYVLNTNFIITPILVELICMCKGIEVFGNSTKSEILAYDWRKEDLPKIRKEVEKRFSPRLVGEHLYLTGNCRPVCWV